MFVGKATLLFLERYSADPEQISMTWIELELKTNRLWPSVCVVSYGLTSIPMIRIL